MKSSIITSLAFAGAALSAPVTKRQAAITDADILQFALTLEHLENAFYKGAISKMPESAFIAAGYSAKYYSDLKYIAHDEEVHVQALTAGLTAAGAKPVAACTYSFPYTDPKSFVTLSSVLEGVGTSAYQGAAPAIASKDYLAIAGSILSVEALHTSMQRGALNQVPAANPFYTALNPNGAYTLAAAFIKSCPSTNAALPFKAFPSLTAVQGVPAAPGIPFEFSMAGSLPAGSFVTFVNGLSVTSVAPTNVGKTFMATIPMTAEGQTYAFVTNANITKLADSAIVAGPAIIEVTPPAPTFDLTIL